MYNIGETVTIKSFILKEANSPIFKQIEKVKITDKWHDYETGYNFHGILVDNQKIVCFSEWNIIKQS